MRFVDIFVKKIGTLQTLKRGFLNSKGKGESFAFINGNPYGPI